MNSIKLSVVIPAFNEVDNFNRGVLNDVNLYLKKQKYTWEVVLVNDGSTDDTLEKLQTFVKTHKNFRVVDIPHGGKVLAVTSGVMAAKGEIVLFSDFDQSTPISEVEKVLEAFKVGADLVIGDRKIEQEWSRFQKLRSWVFKTITNLTLFLNVNDTQCGFKAFKNKIGKELFSKLKATNRSEKGGYMGAFDIEILFLARKFGYKITCIPVVWKYFKSGRLSPISESLKMFSDIFRVRYLDLLAVYNDNPSRKKYHLLPLILLFFLTVPAFWDTLKPGYFPMHDDLQFARQVVMDKCFADRQIPCRWSKDLGYGYGYPLFNYYPPFPYYVGQVFRGVGLAYIDIVKIMVVLNFVTSGLLMYLLAQVFWGRWGGLISGLFYVYAPYHAVDVYARGAMNEAWAVAFFPGVFWALFRLIEQNKWVYILPLSLFSSLVMLSHNLMLMLFFPLALIWTLFWLIKFKNFKVLPKLFLGGVWALGLAAFFTLPVIFEQKYAHVESLIIGYFNYLAHFANVEQLFISRNWGYGDSRYGPIDDISFQIGHLHWVLSLASLLVAFVFAKKKPYLSLMILLMFAGSLFYAFLAHQRSSFVWSVLTPLQFLQFPWRTISLVIFGTSFLAGSIAIFNFKFIRKFRTAGFLLVLVLTLIFYKDYFRWKDYWPWVTDQVKFSGELWKLQTTAGIFDYLPKWAPLPPANPPNGDAEILTGRGEIKTVFKNSVVQEYTTEVREEGVFQINTFYFPGWKYFVDEKEVSVNPEDDKELGRPRIKLTPGEHTVVARFTNTPIRTLGNSLSLVSWLSLLVVLIFTCRRFILRYIKK